MSTLCRAEDMRGDSGIGYGYSVKSRWRPSYPENTGDIATTFLKDPRRRAADSAALPS